MKNIIRVLSILSIVLASNVVTFASEYEDLNKEHWAYEQIQTLTKDKIVAGYPDNTFKPDEFVTKAEFATMVINSFGLKNYPIEDEAIFVDVLPEYWAWGSIQRAIALDLVKKGENDFFMPDDFITKEQAYTVVMNALAQENISQEKAIEVLKEKFVNYQEIPQSIFKNLAKAQILNMIVDVEPYNKFEAEKPASRAELCALLLNMLQQAKLNPNEKLKEAIKPPVATKGFILSKVKLDGYIATIPAGVEIPVQIINNLSSQTSNLGDFYSGVIPFTCVTPEDKFIVFKEQTPISGQVVGVKSAIFILRNGSLNLSVKQINKSLISGIIEEPLKKRTFWQKIKYNVLKGDKLVVNSSEIKVLKTLKPIKVDLIKGIIIK